MNDVINTDAATASQDLKIVTFTLCGHMFGIAMTSLLEIREWEEPTPLPGVPHYVRGVTNLRGNVVPVVGLSERLGWPPSETHARSCTLVVNIAGKQAGFLVDEMNDIVTINMAEIQPPPALDGADTSMICGLVRVVDRSGDSAERDQAENNAMVLLIDVPALSLTRHLDAAA
ncbi:MAG: purine-binding chemotaxis protein CheW [Sphingobium sp.]|nr:purine-binding chemotaxis protein CheW [Sphingobium sp.]MBP6113063.1 purine-binding chemotaxis protein CheW [Sphingobium sp.]MBP8670937.1 purine-binding chemotaxis protein CheW [Sphingobium sp.]MBP9158096.1 purine-binding chemotaxis protein CheW [Sphingobium sp.]MCC6481953.1 purine-binding chemotaxis protein CheW [Sphingomonadaceae bacterium]